MRLLADYPADNSNPAIEQARAQNWVDALEGLPAWAIDRARLKWVRGQVEGANPDFAPKPPRFREIVLSCMAPVYERKSRLKLLLRAEPESEGNLSPERKAELADMLTNLAREIGRNGDPSRPATEQAA